MSKNMMRWIRWSIIAVCLVLVIIRQLYPNFLNIFQNIQIDTFSIILVVGAILVLLLPYLKPIPSYLSKIQKRWLIIIICLILITLKIVFPNTQVDTNSIWLVGIVALLFVLPDLKSLTPYIKRIRIGDAELELKETIGKVGKEIEKAEDSLDDESDGTVPNEVSSEIEQVLHESSKDPRAALLLLSSKIEEQVRRRLEQADIAPHYSVRRSVEIGVKNKIFPQEFLPAFSDFWNVRNQVAHGRAFDVDDTYILSLISLGTQLLRMVSTVKTQIAVEQYPEES